MSDLGRRAMARDRRRALAAEEVPPGAGDPQPSKSLALEGDTLMFNQINGHNQLRVRLRFVNDAGAAGAAGAADTGDGNSAGTATGEAAGAGTADTGSTATGSAWDGKIESLDPAAQKIISDLRKEAADNRVAKNAETERVNAILKAAGIKTDEPDPVQVAKTASEAATKAVRELAVYKAASLAGADPNKLLDRTSFTASIAGIDPSDGSAIKAAIDAAVAADSTLKAARAAGASSLDNSGGTGETGQITEEQLAQMTPEEIVAAQNKGLLRNLLG